MKIVTYCFGKNADAFLLSSWLYFYTKSKTIVPCALFYDKDVPLDIVNSWPYEKVLLKHNINVELTIPDSIWKNNLYCDIMKMLCYRYFGPCIVLDNDGVIKKPINFESIPRCDWGLVKKRSVKSYTFETYGYPQNFNQFDEIKNVDDCYTGAQIVNEDYFDLYLSLFKKYANTANNFYSRGIYGEAIACLTHRIVNGTFLAPEWDWMFDNPHKNKNVIIEHYCSPKGKELLKQKTFNIPNLITYILQK